MNRKIFRITLCILLAALLLAAFALPVLAAGDVSGAIESTWNEAKTQIQNVVNHVVFPVIDMILAILFFVKVATCYFEYRKHGQLELAAPCILFACLIFTLTAPLYLLSVQQPQKDCCLRIMIIISTRFIL